jgi:hypothetical protein
MQKKKNPIVPTTPVAATAIRSVNDNPSLLILLTFRTGENFLRISRHDEGTKSNIDLIYMIYLQNYC